MVFLYNVASLRSWEGYQKHSFFYFFYRIQHSSSALRGLQGAQPIVLNITKLKIKYYRNIVSFSFFSFLGLFLLIGGGLTLFLFFLLLNQRYIKYQRLQNILAYVDNGYYDRGKIIVSLASYFPCQLVVSSFIQQEKKGKGWGKRD